MRHYTMSRRQALLGISALGANSTRVLRGGKTLAVAVLTEPAKGSHLSSYLKGLVRCQGVARVVHSDPSGETFGEAERLLNERLAATYQDHRVLLQKEQPRLAVVSFRTRRGLVGTLNTGYYLDRGYQNQIRVWGSSGWFHLDLPSGKPLKWYSTHPEAPRGIQTFTYQDDPNLYKVILQESIDAALKAAPPPLTTQESLYVLKTIFAAYRSAETATTQRVV